MSSRPCRSFLEDSTTLEVLVFPHLWGNITPHALQSVMNKLHTAVVASKGTPMPEAPSACPVPPASSSKTSRTWECRLDLPNDPRTPRVARHTIRAALLGHACSQDLTDTAELLTSELLSNAVKHSDGLVTVTLRASPDRLHVAVLDNHPDLPSPSPPPPTTSSAGACSSSTRWRTSGAATPSPETSESAAGRWCGSSCLPRAADYA